MNIARQSKNTIHQSQINEGMHSLEKAVQTLNSQWRLNYHFMPPANWMNDPNGLIYHNGEYHVFYQHNPHAPVWGPMYWGHATSTDLVNWTHLPIALAPSTTYDYHPDGGGCYSGSAVNDNGTLTLVYTGRVIGSNSASSQCLATSVDGVVFEKHPANPVISKPPLDGLEGFRDPKVWRHGQSWYMVIGSGRNDKGLILLYTSSDLVSWEYMGIASESDGSQGNMWECPDLFPLGDKHVLIYSPMGLERLKTMYLVGQMDYEKGKFIPELGGELDFGRDYYAAQTFLDEHQRRVVMGWMESWNQEHPTGQHGWVGALTLPRELTLGPDGHLLIKPLDNLQSLRENHVTIENLDLGSNEEYLAPINSDSLELKLSLDLALTTAQFVNIKLRCSAHKEEKTVVSVIFQENQVKVDTTSSGVGPTGVTSCFYRVGEDQVLKLHLFLDKSSLEVFVNDGEAVLTNRIFPQEESLGLRLFSGQGRTHLNSLSMWNLKKVAK